MKNKVLILTNTKDGIHTDSVVDHLIKAGENVARINTDLIPGGKLSLEYVSKDSKSEWRLYGESVDVSSGEIKSIWYRRPNDFNFSLKDPQQNLFAMKELGIILNGLWYTAGDVLWINSPANLELARNKLHQLQLAKKLGLITPETIVTNDPVSVSKFVGRFEKVVTKTLYQCFLDYGDSQYNALTTVVEQRHLDNLDLVKVLPAMFQEYIKKAYELRVTIVGEKVFATKIESQQLPETSIDWRHPKYIGSLPHTAIQLPVAIEQACLGMMRLYGLKFGAFDLVVCPDGEHIFLELNPNGQWYWIEHLTGQQISKSIAKLLAC